MLRRIASFVVLAWLLGFMWFAIFLPKALEPVKSDAVIVYTGGEGRIDRGLEALRKGWAPKLLVSGVDREVRRHEFEAEYDVSPRLMDCCVTLGFESYDTRSNALEAADWLVQNETRTVRLVTTDWHMRRALHDLRQTKPESIVVLPDAVPSEPSLRILFLEYNKLLARLAASLWEELSWLWEQ